jgi:putative SOS response-associated peptidase YedK
MCYWVGTKKVREIIKKRKESGLWDNIDQAFYDNFIARTDKEFIEQYIAIGKGKPTLTTLHKENGQLSFENMQWTLPYSYTDKTGKEITRELQNSTCERVFFQHKDQIYSKRCLVPIDGYIEYHHVGKETYPHYIYPRDENDYFLAAGIYDYGIDKKTGEEKGMFSIITTTPNSFVGRIHNNPEAPNGPRMLLLLPRESAIEYLDETKDQKSIKSFFQPYDQEKMKAHTVLRFQRKENAQFFNTPKVLEPCQYPEFSPTLL